MIVQPALKAEAIIVAAGIQNLFRHRRPPFLLIFTLRITQNPPSYKQLPVSDCVFMET